MRSQRFPVGESITVEQLTGDCHPHLARLRAAEPVSWLPALDGWLVTSRGLAIEVMRDDETFTVDDPRFSTAQVIGPSMLSTDGPEHARHRQPFADPFRAGALREQLGSWTRQRARELVEAVAADGRADLRATVAAPLAIETMERTLDLAGVDAVELLGWYDGIVDAVHAVTEGGAVPPAGVEAYRSLYAAVSDRLFDSRLLAEASGHGLLTTDEIVSNVAVLLFGGVVTAESTTAMAIAFLLADPAVVAEVSADRSLVSGVVEEALRLEPSAAAVDRYATRNVELGGAEIEAGDLVRVSLAGANRDPEEFADPDRYDIRRPSRHLTFARGPHACLGIHLARLETAAAIDAVLDLLPGATLDPDCAEPVTGLVFRAPVTVEVAWGRRHETDL